MRLPVTVLLSATWLAVVLPDRLGASSSCGALLGASLALGLVALDAPRVRPLGTCQSYWAVFWSLCAGVMSIHLVRLISDLSAALVGVATNSGSGSGIQGWTLAVTAVGLAPIFEEYLFRGRVLDHLVSRLGATPAVVLSALLFSAFHVRPMLLIGSFLAGLVLGLLRIATGSLHTCIAYHAGLNTAVLWAAAAPQPGSVVSPTLTVLSSFCLLLAMKPRGDRTTR